MSVRLSKSELRDYDRAVRRSNRTMAVVVLAVVVLTLAAVAGLVRLLLNATAG